MNSTAIGNSAIVNTYSNNSIAFGTSSNVTGASSVAIGESSQIKGSNNVALGDHSQVQNTVLSGIQNGVAIGTHAITSQSYSTAIGSYANASGSGSVAIGQGINVSASTSVGLGNQSSVAGFEGVAIGSKAKINDTTSTQSVAIGAGAEISNGVNSIALGTKAKTSAMNSIALGDNTQVQGFNGVALGSHASVNTSAANGIAIGNTSSVTASSGVALGSATRVTAANSVAIGNGSVADTVVSTPTATINGTVKHFAGGTAHGTVSVGAVNNERTITNVAAGRVSADSTDAVNGSQLFALEGNVNVNLSGVDQEITNLGNRIDTLDNKINKVGAGAAAMASLHPMAFDPNDKWSFATGFGNYRNANAMAIGAFYSPNENTMVNVSGSFGNGENMVGVGFSLKLGKGAPVSRASLQKTVTDLQSLVAKQDAAMKAQDEKSVKQDEALKAQDEKIAKLEALVDQLMKK